MEALNELAESPEYNPYGNQNVEIIELIEADEFDEAMKACEAARATLLLSPEAHMIAAFVASKLGDKELEEMERFLISACLEGMMDTGDGTKQRPWVVSVVSDEYVILKALEKEMSSQNLIQVGDRFLDVVETTDEEQFYFDVSVPYGNLQRRMSKRTSRKPDVDP